MILMYNWDKIFKLTEGDPVEIVRIFRMLTKGQVPDNYYDPIYKYSIHNFFGESYILHPNLLEQNLHNHSHRDVAMYIALAALRPYAEWIGTGTAKLPVDYSQMPVEALTTYVDENVLLDLQDGEVSFCYEEMGGNTIH